MTIPREVKNILVELQKSGFEAYIVGGCVRDFLLGNQANDWDVTANATPEEIQKVFPDSFYENNFLTVTVRTGSEAIPEIEITTYRLEAKYSDKRHPDSIQYAQTLEEDLKRRDFTINSMAIGEKSEARSSKSETNSKFKILNSKYFLIDLFGGQEDLKNKIIRAVGNPEERFNEDALRMLRAVRFATVLGFSIEKNTAEAIKKNSFWMEAISKERIRDEFLKIIMCPRADKGIELLRELGILKYVLPELLDNVGVAQSKHHKFDCYEHAIKSLEFAAKKNYDAHIRLAALLHDIAKPKVKTGEGEEATFYNHEIVGAKIAFQALTRLKFPKKDVEKITKLVRYHLFYYNVGEVTEASVRRLVKNVGAENIYDLLLVRQADRIGSGVPKAEPYKLRHLKYLIEKVAQDPISAKMLKVNGQDIMEILGIRPGPKVGQILDILLGQVLEDPKRNDRTYLAEQIKELGKLSENEIQKMAKEANADVQEVETKKDEMTKQKYWVT